ncbi:glycine oxidase ThiO [Conexibacter woesei]|uniref:glycine oxidase n=1 Tax=Conexibacter woesei (strain DSM 14684 / CCUG 47730 / CIP 108061 / JCM 11494 / NBRC 100937 / ID131577) TaxID=469383 RepID=D3FAD7_CONWI|nr:glycine oxidase ThiO [Conexibacter woesei]ADB49206.1 glycine oxidase ThiO [Conexibacter woesei DSM 14684]
MPQPSQPTFDVAVVGGGIIGLAVAWRAQQRGLRTVLLERDAQIAQGATHAAAGMLAPVSEANTAERELLALGLESAARYPQFVAELAESSALDPGFLRCGTLVVARDRDEAEALDRERAVRAQLGLDVERLLPSEARRREPGLAPTLRLALDVPDDHAVDPRALALALAAALRAAGGDLRTGAAVQRIDTSAGDSRVSGVTLAGGERIAAEHVVVAAGAWTQQLAGLPGDACVPVRPVKGQILRLRDPAGPGLFTRVLRMDPGYLVPRGDGRYVLGATMEERGYDTDVTAGGVFELLRDASELVPGISELILEELEAGLRPGTPDNAPALGPGALAGLHWAAGHHRNGILLAPVTADLLLASLLGDPLGELAAPFTPTRFGAQAKKGKEVAA